jgi:predicted dithiol-disulfide oxidoreductase (DUF899 family)
MNTAIAEAGTSRTADIADHAVVSPDRWIAERRALLAHEKELMRLRDEIARKRRALPWERVATDYVFDAPEGRRALSDLFEGRRQLLVQHFMLGPGWEEGCPSCSYMADHTDGMTMHLAHRDVSFVAVSRAPLAEIERFKKRMGWKFRWVSSSGNDFNRDFHVSFAPEDRVDGAVYYNYGMTGFPNTEAPGVSVFYKDDAGEVSTPTHVRARRRSDDGHVPDARPRAEGPRREDVPNKMEWVRHHDRYEPAPPAGSCCHANA